MKFNENDVVKAIVTKDTIIPGDVGTVIFVFGTPNEAYEIEFLNANGSPKSQGVFLPEEIERYQISR